MEGLKLSRVTNLPPIRSGSVYAQCAKIALPP